LLRGFSTKQELGRETPFVCGSQRYMELLRFHSKTFWVTPVVTPLPAALPLFVTGLGAFGLIGWRRKRKQTA
jgi:hypothetical protein